jgi:hypothetical protein
MERVPIESSQCPGPKRTLTLEPLEQRLLLQADWTFMVYLDGDNNLESAALKDFAEMAHVGSTADVNIVVQMDRSPLDQTSGQGYTNADGDWSGARVGLVNQNDVPDTTWGTALGDTDMGDPNVLQAFLTSAMTSYQANHYAVILWDHGNGYDGAEYDDTSGTHLSLADISSALSGALTATGVAKFDLLNFDGCNMNTAEVANQVENVAGILVGSEDVEPLDGLPYDQVLGSLTAQPQMTAAELGNTIAQDYQTYYSGTLGGNYSVIDLTEMGPLSSALSGFATTFMNDATATDRFRFGLHLATVPHYFSPDGPLRRRADEPGRSHRGQRRAERLRVRHPQQLRQPALAGQRHVHLPAGQHRHGGPVLQRREPQLRRHDAVGRVPDLLDGKRRGSQLDLHCLHVRR